MTSHCVARRMVNVQLQISFLLRGSQGRVYVESRPATGVASSGRGVIDPTLPPGYGAGLPECTATISYAGTGYAAAMGWVQFARSTDATRPDVFQLDPLVLCAGVDTPYAFFGIAPTLFDAPYRDTSQDVVWQARSYLATTPDAVLTQAAVPLVAFTWGFRIRAGSITLEPPAPLDVAHWSEHLSVLEGTHPGWNFRRPMPPDGG